MTDDAVARALWTLVGRFDEYELRADERHQLILEKIQDHETRITRTEKAPSRRREALTKHINLYATALLCGSGGGIAGAILARLGGG